MSRTKPLPLRFYRRPTERVARELLGRYIVRDLAGERLVLRIVETEAYLGAPDRASHAWGGRRTARKESLYLPGGHAYVYFIYGMHFCLNVVTEGAGLGSAVLIRAGEPVAGEERMLALRGLLKAKPGDIAGGPGRLCKALGIGREDDGVRFDRGALKIVEGEPLSADEIATGARVGIDYAADAVSWPLRFAIRGNPHVSRPRL